MIPVPPRGEPPVYRPFALLALGATVLAGTPIGLWLLAWRYLGLAAVPPEGILLHASLQVQGFFGTLIVGMAQHVLPRFAGRPVTRSWARWLAWPLGLALASRTAGATLGLPAALIAGAALQAVAFGAFATWVWRALPAPDLAPARRLLTVSTAWLALACLLEVVVRAAARADGLEVPPLPQMRAIHAMALLGGVVGWVLGVLLRAGPMLLPRWAPPAWAAGLLPWGLGAGAVLAAAGEAGPWGAAGGAALARLGELVALGTGGAVLVRAGAVQRARRALPLAGTDPVGRHLVVLALASGAAAIAGSAIASVLAWAEAPSYLLTDTSRHFLTIGVLVAVVAAMAWRLVPALEATPLRWPLLRVATLWLLTAGVVLRSSEVLLGLTGHALAPAVVTSGVLVWLALLALAASVAGTRAGPPR